MNALGVVGTCYKRGYEGKPYPKWARKGKNPMSDAYKLGCSDRKKGMPSRITDQNEKK